MKFTPKDTKNLEFRRYYSAGQRTYAERTRRKLITKRVLIVLGLALAFVLGFFVMSLLLEISSLPV